jgi:hypothetical protein
LPSADEELAVASLRGEQQEQIPIPRRYPFLISGL